MTDETPQVPDETVVLANALMDAAGLCDAAVRNVHDTLGNLMDAFKNIAAFIAAENAELKGRLAGLEK